MLQGSGGPPTPARRPPYSTAGAHAIETLLDKWQFACCLRREAIPHPRTMRMTSRTSLDRLSDATFNGVFLKPQQSQAFSRQFKTKAFPVEGRDDAARRLRVAFEHGYGMVLLEYIPGPPCAYYFLDGFVDRHGRCSMLARRRVRMYPMRFGNSSYTVSIPLGEVATAAECLRRLFRALRYRGMFDAEFVFDERDGVFKLLEVNPRPWWQLEFAEVCGVPVCRMAYEDALGRDVEPVVDYLVGRRGMIFSQDVQAFRALRPAGSLGLWPWLRSCARAHDLVFRWSDPGPAIAQLWGGARTLFQASGAETEREDQGTMVSSTPLAATLMPVNRARGGRESNKGS